MDYQIYVDILKEQVHIFGLCPCCGDIFNLSDVIISTGTKKAIISETKSIIELQNKNYNLEDKYSFLSEKLEDNHYNIMDLKEEARDTTTIEIVKKKIEGRKEAIKKTKSFFPLFAKKNIDPRDLKLIFSPIEFVVFNGMAEKKKLKNIVLLGKKPDNKEQEKIVKTIVNCIEKGNLDFKVIRFSESGNIEYE